MDFDAHVKLGTRAVAMGLLDVARLSEIMLEVGLAGGEAGEDVWLAPGRLDAGALERVRAELTRARPSGDATVVRLGAHAATPDEGPRSLPTFGRYARCRLLGSGGMGDVEECDDVTLGRKVAVKSIRPGVPDRALAVRMLEHEAKVTGRLAHPNIIAVYDFGADARRGPFYVMPIAEQASLADVIERVAARDVVTMSTQSLGKLLRIFIQVCNAIGYAHTKGYAHRDLKPANVLLGSFGEVLVVDWGVAATLGEPPAVFGGTPGYIAPEQLDDVAPVDARSDVFALGSVLYEIIAQAPCFSHQTAVDLALAAANPREGYRFVPPSERAPAWPVPEDLVEICRRAVAADVGARFATAHELGDAIEQHLEGTKEAEQRRQRADEHCRQGDDLALSYEDLLAEQPKRVEEFIALRDAIPPWEPEETKQPLWDLEDGFLVMESLAARTMQSTVASYEQALDEVPDHEGARRGLARLYARELRRAEDRRDNFERVYFGEKLRQIHDGEEAPARLSIDTHAMEAEVRAYVFEERARRLEIGEGKELGWTKLDSVPLAGGSYVLSIKRPGHAAVRYPVLLRADDDVRVVVDLSQSFDVGDGEAFVPAGPALLGGDFDGRDLREALVPSFVIQTAPVSFGDYFDFLAEVYRVHAALGDNYLPLADDGSPYFSWAGSRFKVARAQMWGGDLASLLRLPVVGVDAWGAEAYAAWKSRRTGRMYRLPTEEEWEKAGRGVDGRRYPWGDRFDPSFCKMRDSRRGIPAPEPSRAFACDVSVYGVHDMAGGVADWVITGNDDARADTQARRMVSRGGAYCDPEQDCRMVTRRHHLAMERSPRVGFRLVRTATSRSGTSRRDGSLAPRARLSIPADKTGER
ncbi:MAG: SUMF1/EgtB/PvdO family nonheme iron enzyme [Polyangiaceae bacterium]|nr:SUMF1/EgtB/PvdO family nonheme iron enzyme [Polyangiaceae bacterium]